MSLNVKYGTRSESHISHLHKRFYSVVIPDTAYIGHSIHHFSSEKVGSRNFSCPLYNSFICNHQDFFLFPLNRRINRFNSFTILTNIFFFFLTGMSSRITPIVSPFSNSFSNCQFTITVLG